MSNNTLWEATARNQIVCKKLKTALKLAFQLKWATAKTAHLSFGQCQSQKTKELFFANAEVDFYT
jgi:hypothetical protein